MSRKYIMLFGDTRSAVDELDDAAAGRLLKAVLQYADRHEEVDLPGAERLVYRLLLNQFARDEEAYRKRCDYNRRYRESQKEEKRTEKNEEEKRSIQYKDEYEDKDEDKDKEEYKDKDGSAHACQSVLPVRHTPDDTPDAFASRSSTQPPVFTPPTPDEVRSYALEANLSFDADRFCDYNAARGWMQGNRPISDWKAAARLWASRGDLPSVGSGAPRGGKVLEQQQYSQREYTNSYDALDAMMARWAKENPDEAGRPRAP